MIDERKLIEEIDYYISHTCENSKEHYAYKQSKKLVEKQPKVNEWIPVSEKLPEVEKEVLVCTYGYSQRVWCLLDHDEEYVWEDEFGGWNEFEDVIAWMLLPERYKSE